MKKVIYLFGAGATKAEIVHQAFEADITMKGIAENVLKLSKENNGEYAAIIKKFGISGTHDIEIIISLLEGFNSNNSFKEVCNELRTLFRQYLISQITERGVEPKIHSSLLHLHNKYGGLMGENGEEITAVLTTNYDSILDEAYFKVYNAINLGQDFQSTTYDKNETIPPLLKLHGSFNWKIENDKLIVSKDVEKATYKDDCKGWMPPSVYKKPKTDVFCKVWDTAAKLTSNCDILRVIGSSLRNEDFALLSLLFTSQLKKVFNVELIVPDKDALGEDSTSDGAKRFLGIMERITFLGQMKNLSSLPVFMAEYNKQDNVFLGWLLMKIKEIEMKKYAALDDDFINSNLLLEV